MILSLGASVRGTPSQLWKEEMAECRGHLGGNMEQHNTGKGPESTMPHFLGSQWHRLGLQPGVQEGGTGEKVAGSLP